MPQDKLPIPQFAAKIKAKYPEYKDIEDTVLVQKILAKYPEYGEQVDISGVVKKKSGSDLSMVGGKAVSGGGEVGSSAPQSERDKIANYVKTLGGVKVTKTAPQVPAKQETGKSITQVKTTKKPETTFDQTVEEAVTGGIKKINEIMYDTNDDWQDPIKVTLEKSADRTKGNKENLDYLAANVLTRDAILKSGYNASKMLETTPIWAMAKVGENMTADLLKQKAREFEIKVANFKSIGLDKLDDGSGIGNDEFYKYVYGDRIYDAAVKAYAYKNPNFKEQLIAKGATNEDFFERNDLYKFVPQGKLGQIVSETIYDPDVIEYIKNEQPYLLPAVKSVANSLIEDDKTFGANVVSNKVSKEYLKRKPVTGLSMVANFATQGMKDELNQVAKDVLTDQEYRVYQQKVLGNEENYIDTPSMLEGFARGGKEIFKGIKSTFTTPFKSTEEVIDKQWEDEASNVSADPKGFLKFLTDSGHTLGIVAGIGATGNVLGGGGAGFYSTKVVPALSGAVPFLGDMLQEGTMKYPDSPVKAWTSAMFNTALYAALSYRIFPAKDVEKAFTAVKPEVAVVIKNLTNGSITREVARKEMNTIAVKALDFLAGTQIKSGKIAAELTGISALNQMLDKVMGMDDKTYEKYHPEGELSDTFGSLFLSNQFVGGLAKYGEMKRGNRIVEASLYEAATNPVKYRREIDLLKTKDESIDQKNILENLDYLVNVKKELVAMGVKPKNQGRYLFESLKEKVFSDAIKSTPDANLTRRYKEQIARGEEVKDRILRGEDVVKDENFEIQKEKGGLTEDQVQLKKAFDSGVIKDKDYRNMVEQAMKDPEEAKKFISEIKSQATGDVQSQFGNARDGVEKTWGKDLVDYAANKVEITDNTNNTINKVKNAEWVNEKEIKEAEDNLYDFLDKNPQSSNIIEPLILQLQEYEFTTKTETVKVTEKVPTGTTAKTKVEIKPILSQSIGQPVTITDAKGRTVKGVLREENGKYVVYNESGDKVSVIGEKAINDRDLKLPEESEVENPIKFDENGNVKSVTVKTRDGILVEINNPEKALDIAIQLRISEFGEIPDSLFSEIYTEVEKSVEIEVPKYPEKIGSNEKVEKQKTTENAVPIRSTEEVAAEQKAQELEQKKQEVETEKQNEITEATKPKVEAGSVGVGGDVKLGNNTIIADMSLPFDSGVNTGLVKNSKGAVYHDKNTAKLEKLGYSKEQIDNLSQTELNEILAKNIENPNVATSAKLPIAKEQITTQEFLNEASKDGGKFAELAKVLKQFFGIDGVKTEIVKGLKDFFGKNNDGDYANNKIRIDEKAKNKLQTFLHEAIHKVTVDKLLQFERGDYSKLSKQDIEAIQNLIRIFNESKVKIHEFLGGGKGDRTKGYYGFTNVHEFISEAFTNPEFQSLLRNLPTEGKTPTIFKQFLDAVAKFFGTKDASILNDIFHHTENLREQSLREQPKAGSVGVGGEGKKVYHGTSHEGEFDKESDGLIWFTDNKKIADQYRKRNVLSNEANWDNFEGDIDEVTESETGIDVFAEENGIDLTKGNIIEGNINPKKPLNFTEFDVNVDDVGEVWDALYETKLVKEKWEDFDEEQKEEIEDDYKGKAIWRMLEGENIYDEAKKQGYDAVIINDVGVDGKPHISYGLFGTKSFQSKPKEQSLREQPKVATQKSDIDAKKEAIETEKQQAITEATKPVVDLELLGDETQTIDLITEKASGDKDGGKAKIRQHERIRVRLQALKDLIDCV